MTTKAQERFLKWAKTKKDRWPETNSGKYRISVLDLAIQELIADYLRSKDISPLRQFLETSATFLLPTDAEKLKPPSVTNTSLSPTELARAKMVYALCEVYGFMGDFETAWQVCVQSGLDSDEEKYLIYGVHSKQRKFTARQAYYFPGFRPPITDAGRIHKAGIYPLVEDELRIFEAKEGKNLFDFYLDISNLITWSCFQVADLEDYSKPKGENAFERGEFQKRILNDVCQRFEVAMHPFENRLKEVFADPTEFTKLKRNTLERPKMAPIIFAKRKKEFLYRYFYVVCRSAEKFGVCANIWTLGKIFKDNDHQIEIPQMPQLVRICMAKHIAKIFRDCEDRFRQGLGLRGVGQGWVSEATLFALLKKKFPEQIVLQHASPEWIGRQHLDIYFPRLNLAVEYQGVQHEHSVAIFGGEAALNVRKRLDKKKKELCSANNCRLIEVFPGEPMEQVVEQIKACLATEKTSIVPNSTNEIKSIAVQAAEAKQVSPITAPKKLSSRHSSKSWKKNLSKDDLPACARHGDGELIRRLASELSTLKTFRNDQEETLLLIACKEGNFDTAMALLEVGLDPNARDYRKASILSKICNRWNVRPKPEIIRLLLKHGADPKLHGTLTPVIFDRCGYALPMNGCAIDGFLDCAKILFESLRDVNQQQPISLFTPLMCACHPFERHKFEHRSVDMIRWLIESGADLTMRSKSGFTPMDFALGGRWSGYFNVGNLRSDQISSMDILKLLDDAGARPSEEFKPILDIAIKRTSN